jgi:hypothetical protein
MNKLATASIVALLISVALSAQNLTDAQILAAIKAGESKKFDHLISDCVATSGFGESMAAGMGTGVTRTGAFSVTVSTNEGRIAFMAARAKRLYKPFVLENVSEDLRAPAVVVSIEPNDPSTSGKTIRVAAPIEHVVLKSKAKSAEVTQPEKVEMEPVEWSNLVGGKVAGNRAVAFFDYGAVQELPAGEFDIVVITAAGERKCKVGLKDRQKLFTPTKQTP